MTETAFDTSSLLAEIDGTAAQLLHLMSSLNEQEVNTVPFEGSWTSGQLFRHVTKATSGIAKAMQAEATPAERAPDEKVAEFKKTFLDFTTKMQSPEMLVPEAGPYEKTASLEKLGTAFGRLRESASGADLSGLVQGLPMGEVTKLELLHFVLYHTQRHLHQMQKIHDVIQSPLS